MADDLPPGIDLPERPLSEYTLSRCWPDTDAQRTLGDGRGSAWICLAWARGCCLAGAGCESLHRLPSLPDEQRLLYSADGLSNDIFGRRREALPTAVTSLADPLACQTIHVEAGLPGETQRERRSALQELGEWGQIAKTWVLADAGTGFIKFKWRSSAQFAMEALQDRPLRPDGAVPLRLRWATVDPSLTQQVQGRQLALGAYEEARRRARGAQELYDRLESEGSSLKRRREGEEPTREEPAPAAAADPQRDEYLSWVEAPEQPLNPVAAVYPGGSGEVVGGDVGGQGERQGTQEAVDRQDVLPPGWVAATDPATGCMYFYHSESQRTQWERPSSLQC